MIILVAMRISIIFHGPEIFDTGWAQRIIATMKTHGAVEAYLSGLGVMGRTAIIDHGLEDSVHVKGKLPSECLREVAPHSDLILFATYAKNPPSGYSYCEAILERAQTLTPTIQIDANSRTCVLWRGGEATAQLLAGLQGALGLARVDPPQPDQYFWRVGERNYRRIRAANPGDLFMINGLILGRVADSEVVIAEEGGRVVELRGVDVKPHGLEKLSRCPVDLETAKIDSGVSIRRTESEPRLVEKEHKGKVAFIEHAGLWIFELIKDAGGAVVVGDDTTSVASEVLYRFQIPIAGITDGDSDNLLNARHITKGSVILRVKSDDDLSARVSKEIFHGKMQVEMDFEEAKRRVIALSKDELVDLIEIR